MRRPLLWIDAQSHLWEYDDFDNLTYLKKKSERIGFILVLSQYSFFGIRLD